MLSSRPITDKKEDKKEMQEKEEGSPMLGGLLRGIGYQGVLKK